MKASVKRGYVSRLLGLNIRKDGRVVLDPSMVERYWSPRPEDIRWYWTIEVGLGFRWRWVVEVT